METLIAKGNLEGIKLRLYVMDRINGHTFQEAQVKEAWHIVVSEIPRSHYNLTQVQDDRIEEEEKEKVEEK